jgi:hypothetical protein
MIILFFCQSVLDGLKNSTHALPFSILFDRSTQLTEALMGILVQGNGF